MLPLASYALLAFVIGAPAVLMAAEGQRPRAPRLPSLLSLLAAPVALSPYTTAAFHADPRLTDLMAVPSAVYCEATRRWRHPVTRRFVKAPR